MAVDSAQGVQVRSEKGRAPQRNEGPVLRWMEAGPVIEKRLTNLSAGGDDRVRSFRPPVAQGRGDAALALRADLIPRQAGRRTARLPLRASYSGMLPCLRQGLSSFLPASITSERQIRRRVSCGWITSSM